MQFTLLLSLIALTLAGYAVDFDPTSPRDAGSSFWLEDGSWEAVVTGRTDLGDSFLEIHLFPADANADCWWSLWSDDAQVTSGVFRSATASVVSILSGTIPNDGETLTITTSGCWVGRYANPFQMGDNDGVWLADLSPSAQDDLTTIPAGSLGAPLSSSLGDQSYRNQLNFVQAAQGLCRFSNQACNQAVYAEDSLTDGYWVSSGGPVLVTWDGSTVIQATDEVLIEVSSWYQNADTVSFGICNSSLACNTDLSVFVYETYYYTFMNYNSRASAWNLPKKRSSEYVGPDPLFDSYVPATMNSTRNFARRQYHFEPIDELFSGVSVRFSYTSIVPPYAKVWGLAGNYSETPAHQMIDLRGLLGTACDEQDISTGLTPFYSESNFGYPQYGCEAQFQGEAVFSAQVNGEAPALGQADQTNWFWCGQSQTLHGTDPTSAECDNFIPFSDTTSTTQVATSDVDVTGYIFPQGGFITPVTFDLGAPCVYSSECSPVPALNQLSNFDYEFDGTSVGNSRQWFLEHFDSNQVRGDGVGGYVFGANPEILTLRSAESFSIVSTSFIAAFAFPTPLCDPSACLNGGWCSSDFVEECSCHVPWTGATCEQRVDLCPDDDSLVCMNGGVCGNNDDAQFSVATIDGVDAPVFSFLFKCDCSGTDTTRVNGTGPFYGDLCQYPPPCDNKPCFNDGVCVNEGQDQFTCDCSDTLSPNSTKPFNGTLCEISQTTTCDINPCENGGVCTPDELEPSGYSCSCVGGWTGPTCAIPPTTGCEPTTCQPFGVCIASSNPLSTPAFTQCVCLYGYSGDSCGTAPTGCDAETCENGGACVGFYGADSSNINCLCPHPWVGQHCQWNSTAYNTATSQAAGLFVVIVALLATLI